MLRLIASFGALLMFAGSAAAQRPSEPTADTRESCESYWQQMLSYVRNARQQERACREQYPPSARWITIRSLSCGSGFYWGPDGCQSFNEEAWCANREGHKIYLACLNRAREASTLPQDENSFSRRVSAATTVGVPGALTKMGLGLGGLKSDKIKFGDEKKRYADIFNEVQNNWNGSLADKVYSSSRIVGELPVQNPLSSELLKVAIAGTASTHKTALTDLTRELDRFSIEHRAAMRNTVLSQRQAIARAEQVEIAREQEAELRVRRDAEARRAAVARERERARQRARAEEIARRSARIPYTPPAPRTPYIPPTASGGGDYPPGCRNRASFAACAFEGQGCSLRGRACWAICSGLCDE